MNKKGSITIYLSVFIASVIIIVLASVLAPAGVLLTSEFYTAGENILLQANDSISNIADATVRGTLLNATDAAFNAGEMNIETLTDFYQYSWIIVLVMVGFIGFLFTRAMVERQTLGGGFI